MRTKTLLLTAALSAAGIATSMAQVYSVNAVGYVNTTLVPGFNLISNPLNAADNSVSALFRGGISGAIPNNFTVYVFENGNFSQATYDDIAEAFLPPENAAKTITPGNGAFVRVPGTTPITVTFVGEVPQGAPLRNPLPAGFSIKASQVPQEGTADALGLQGAQGDSAFLFNETTQAYEATSSYDDIVLEWIPPLKPLAVGEAFFLFKRAAGEWTRTFSVNQ
jgi:hypothetical protein